MKLFFIILSLFSFCSWGKITPRTGLWRFEIQQKEANIPFLVELKAFRRHWEAEIINGKEKFKVDKIKVRNGKWILHLQTYQNYLEIDWKSRKYGAGSFVKFSKGQKSKVPLKAYYGGLSRFEPKKEKPQINLSGTWEVSIDGEKAIALFDQTGRRLQASILTDTGDYRFISGHVFGKSFEAANFDGVFNFVFQGKLDGQKLKAEILSSTKSKVVGVKNPKAKLVDSYQVSSAQKAEVSFKNLKGEQISLSDKRYQNKAIILQVFGSWCPNCIDELNFLIPWYQTKPKDIEVIGLSFERTSSEQESRKLLKKVISKREVPYEMLLVGKTAEETPTNKLPWLKNFSSYPTTIFLDKKHQVYKVHSGFTGPGTGIYFDQFKEEFYEIVNHLIK